MTFLSPFMAFHSNVIADHRTLTGVCTEVKKPVAPGGVVPGWRLPRMRGCWRVLRKARVVNAGLVKNRLGVAGATAALLRNAKCARHFTERRATVGRTDADLAVGDGIAKTHKHGLPGTEFGCGFGKAGTVVYRNSLSNAIDNCSH